MARPTGRGKLSRRLLAHMPHGLAICPQLLRSRPMQFKDDIYSIYRGCVAADWRLRACLLVVDFWYHRRRRRHPQRRPAHVERAAEERDAAFFIRFAKACMRACTMCRPARHSDAPPRLINVGADPGKHTATQSSSNFRTDGILHYRDGVCRLAWLVAACDSWIGTPVILEKQ